jgi:carbamoyl-phosphate synthase large subunit
MGVHTGDSVTIAPAQTLTDALYQELRDQAIRVIRAVGVETGGSNIQFAVNPETSEVVVIEMNPRVSRSSALASKATGFPIAKIAARLAVGYALEEIPNDITEATPASFEPTIDYVVTKVPRFAFEKFPGAEGKLSTHMKSVGEAMAIGRTFRESFAKAMRSRELDAEPELPASTGEMLERLATPSSDRFDLVLEGFRRGVELERIADATMIDPWFLRELRALATDGDGTEGLERSYRAVDTCAAEFEARTPYFYSAHERAASEEIERGDNPSVVILGSGPNRIGQGIEFDYCCVHAAMTARALGRDAVMINCNPETVSTDYDTSDRLYFEPLTADDVLAVTAVEQPEGVIVQFGGQTPLRLARALEEAGVPLLGTPVDAIDLAEDRGRFGALLKRLEIKHPPYGTALSAEEAVAIADDVGFPLLVRPSYVLGGRAMEICYSAEALEAYLKANVKADQEHPLLLDRFLENAIEVDVDALADGEDCFVAGIMQHVEEAGVHSGDSACVLPPMSLGEEMLEEIRGTTRRIALDLGVIGLINVQYAVADGELFVIEANPRASRTVPFVSKAMGAPLAKIACRLMLGESLADQELPREVPEHVSVKEAVLPFARFAGADAVLGPEMRSTGEVMGIAADFPTAFGKAQAAAGVSLPREGTIFVSVTDTDKPAACQMATRFHDLGFKVIATSGTAQAISAMGVPVRKIKKIGEGSPNVVDCIDSGEVDMVINTPTGTAARADGYEIRTAAVRHGLPCLTTMTGASAAARAIFAHQQGEAEVRALQELHSDRVTLEKERSKKARSRT